MIRPRPPARKRKAGRGQGDRDDHMTFIIITCLIQALPIKLWSRRAEQTAFIDTLRDTIATAMSQQARPRKYICPICRNFARNSYSGILRHIGEVHSFGPDFHVVCGLGPSKCPVAYTKFESFRSHVYKKHRQELFCTAEHVSEEDNGTSCGDSTFYPNEVEFDSPGPSSDSRGGDGDDQMTRAAALFILKTMEIHKTSQVCI